MKTWFIKKYISLAEAFEWPTPDWIRHWFPSGKVDALLAEEQALTRALKQGRPEDIPAPANLEYLVEARIAATRRPDNRKARLATVLIPSSGLVAVAILGIYMIVSPGNRIAPQANPITQAAQVADVVQSLPAVIQLPGLNNVGEGDLIMRPLVLEKARLTADLTNALKYVAAGVVPDTYVDRVNERLDSFNAAYGNPI